MFKVSVHRKWKMVKDNINKKHIQRTQNDFKLQQIYDLKVALYNPFSDIFF